MVLDCTASYYCIFESRVVEDWIIISPFIESEVLSDSSRSTAIRIKHYVYVVLYFVIIHDNSVH